MSLDQALLLEGLNVLFLTIDIHRQSHGEEDVDKLQEAELKERAQVPHQLTSQLH